MQEHQQVKLTVLLVDYDHMLGVTTIKGDVEWCGHKNRGNNNNTEYESRINNTEWEFTIGVAGGIIVFL